MSLYLGNNLISGNKPINLGVRNIGEIVYSSLPLTDAGFHLLDGSLLQYGIYKDFIDYIANLYNAQETEWTQPVLTSNGTLGGDTFAVYASNNYDATTYPIYKSFDGNSSTIWYDSTTPVDVTIYNPNPLKVTNIQCQNRVDADNYTFTAGTVYGSNDNTNYTQIGTFTNNVTTAGGTYNIDLSSNTNFYYYYKITFTSATQNGVGANFTITATQQSAPNYFCNESQWQQMVSTYGSCGKFVYDSVNNTVRLPKITGIVEGTTDLTALGDLAEAGLPNITGTNEGGSLSGVITFNQQTIGSGAILLTNLGYPAAPTGGDTNFTRANLSFDASRSNPIYGNSNTVQPQTIKCFVYIVIANSTKTEIQVDIDQVATDLNGKADTDLTNATDQAKILMGGMAMPSDKYINLTLGANGSTYTAPTDGYFYINALSASNSQAEVTLDNRGPNGDTHFGSTSRTYASNQYLQTNIEAKKGDRVYLFYGNIKTPQNYFRFVYAKGTESEAS